jgi:hypothetical protein
MKKLYVAVGIVLITIMSPKYLWSECNEGPTETGGEVVGNPVTSVDPNEMAGPLGLGDPNTERFVKPGEWMTYTVYFENMTNATATPNLLRGQAATSTKSSPSAMMYPSGNFKFHSMRFLFRGVFSPPVFHPLFRRHGRTDLMFKFILHGSHIP